MSDLCDCSDAYIVVKGTITVTDPNNNAHDKKLAFKNNGPFISCISKVDNALIDKAKDLDIVMSMRNLIQHSKSYSNAAGSLCNYYRNQPNSGGVGDIKYPIRGSKSFDYKTSITWRLEGYNIEKRSLNYCTIKIFQKIFEKTRYNIS